MHCTAEHVGPTQKTTEPIEMPFEMMSGLGLRNSVLCGGDDPRRKRGNVWGKRVPDKPITPDELRIGLVHSTACTR